MYCARKEGVGLQDKIGERSLLCVWTNEDMY